MIGLGFKAGFTLMIGMAGMSLLEYGQTMIMIAQCRGC